MELERLNDSLSVHERTLQEEQLQMAQQHTQTRQVDRGGGGEACLGEILKY